MRRGLAFLVRNWPLKLAAIALATLLYAGIVLSENVQTFDGSIPIVPVRQPTNAVIVDNLPSVTNIRYIAPTDVAGRLSRDSFRASIDLASARPTPENPFVTVRVDLSYADSRVRILDYSPQVIPLRLDPLVHKTVPIQVDHGPVPSGLAAADPVIDATDAVVTGPDSVVRLVAAARARVLIQSSGLDVDQNVPLVPVDALGNQLGPAELDPAEVHVTLRVGSQATTKTLPINPVVNGSPADGFEVSGVTVSPVVATVSGDADLLAPLSAIDTGAVSIAGATQDVVSTVPLAVPNGLSALSNPQAKVTIAIRPVTGSRTFDAGIRITGARDDRTYRLSADSVTVTLGGTVASLDRVDPTALAATLDVTGLDPGAHAVKLTIRLPAGTTLVGVAPTSITVTVASAAAATPTPTPGASASPAP